jgi:N-terminal domain of galactosyltransferase
VAMPTEPFGNMESMPSITCVTACMGRLHHLKHTLARNINWNRNYPRIDWLVLDYNCPDETGRWIFDNLGDELKSGMLNCWHTEEPINFHYSHARNMAARLATGDILCLVDADNFTGPDFAFYLARELTGRNALVGCRMEGDQFAPANDLGTCGRLAIMRTQFFRMGGYDEAMLGWGYEDIDFFIRLQLAGIKCSHIDKVYLDCIAHDDSERSKHVTIKTLGRENPYEENSSCRANLERSKHNTRIGNLIPNGVKFGCGIVYNTCSAKRVIIAPHQEYCQ